ncbi:MAG: hypothetical protein ABSG46_20100, partial [Candidatus Binataceae bacterium]
REKKLVLPSSISSREKVYWVEFPMSFRELDYDRLQQLMFGVKLPPQVHALTLLPDRIGTEHETSHEVQTPSVKIEAEGIGLDLGEWYKSEDSFKSLKPTIVSEGLGESRFAWILEGDAVSRGSRRFIAIIDVPKSLHHLDINLVAGAKTKGILWIGAKFAESNPTQVRLRLP